MAVFLGGPGIQWSGQITSQDELAHVIQGESGTRAGQFGVASVMWNRSQNGGFGGTDMSAIVTPHQFNGYSATAPTPYAQSLAADLWNGQAPQGGSTGNALFFAAPNAGNANWANPNSMSGQGLFGHGGNNLGGNYFSDVQGAPSANFQAPVYGGETNLAHVANAANDSNYGTGDPAFYSSGSGAQDVQNQQAQQSAATSGSPASYSSGSGAADAQAATTDPTGISGPDVTANATDVAKAIDQQTKANAQDTGALNAVQQSDTASTNQTAQSDTGAALSSGTSWINSFFAFGTDLFKRGFIVALGVSLIIAALFLLGAHEVFGNGGAGKAAKAALEG